MSLEQAVPTLQSEPSLPADHRCASALLQAYALYRTGHLQEAMDVVAEVPSEQGIPKLQLEAQLQYRLGRFAEAIVAYNKLFQQHKVQT